MVQVSVQSEFMQNAFPASKFQVKDQIAVVQDVNGEHMVFALEDGGVLSLILKGSTGNNEVINLNQGFDLNTDQSVKTFAVSQNIDLTIHLVLVVEEDDEDDKVIAIQPTAATYEAWANATDLAASLFDIPDWEASKVREVLLSTSSNSDSDNSLTAYPQLFITVKLKGKQTEDIWSVAADTETRSLTRRENFEMPCNPGSIADKAAATLGDYRGLFVLYREERSKIPNQMRFIGLDATDADATITSVDISVPDGARSFATYHDSSGNTQLLVVGKELTWLDSESAISGESPMPSTFDTGDGSAYIDATRILVAQSGTSFSLWSRDKKGSLSFQEFSVPEDVETAPKKATDRLLLLDPGEASNIFAALLNSTSGQMLFVIDENDQLLMLEQDLYTGLWREAIPVSVPSRQETMEFPSFTIRFQLSDFESDLRDTLLRLRSSTASELIINGRTRRGNPGGIRVTPDAAGTITVIVRSENELSAPILTLDNWEDDFLVEAVAVDPATRIWSKLQGVRTGKDLRQLKMPDGSQFVDESLSDKELDKTAKTLTQLMEVRDNILYGTEVSTVELVERVPEPEPSWIERIWGWFRWIGRQIAEGARWVVKKVGEAWKFIVDIAGKAYNFVLQTVQQVVTAVKSVLDHIVKGVQKVIKFFTFLFEWNDILDVKNIFVNIATRTMLQGVDGLSHLQTEVDNTFEGVKSSVRAWTAKGKKLPSNLGKKKLEQIELEDKGESDSSAKEAQDAANSPQANHGTYHLRHSGDTVSSNSSPFSHILENLSEVFKSVHALSARLLENFAKLFKLQGSKLTAAEVLAQLGTDLIEDILTVIQKLIVHLLTVFEEIIMKATELLNEPIYIPVLSWLYRKITGNDLSILDAVALVLAIPTTIVYKVITGKRPRDLPSVQSWLSTKPVLEELKRRKSRSKQDQQILRGAKFFKQVDSFFSDLKVIYPIISVGLPIAGSIWWFLDTWPGSFPTPPIGSTGTLKTFAGNAIIFALSMGGAVDLTKTFDEQWNDPEKNGAFAWGFYAWLSGAVPILAGLIGGPISNVIGLAIEAFQAVALGISHGLTAQTESFNTYVAVEDWLKLTGDMATDAAALIAGKDMFVTNFVALALRGTGNQMNVWRAIYDKLKSSDGSPPVFVQAVMAF